MISPLINKKGITIKQLKELVRDLPEVDNNGDDYELWVENTGDTGLSNPATIIMQLNQGDLIIGTEKL